MVHISLLDLNDDCLYALCVAASLVHPPHWVFPDSKVHDWQPSSSYDDHYDLSEQRHFCLGWVHLSHVCGRLRRICTDSPSLWATAILALPSKDAWKTFLERSRDATLELCIPTNHCRLREYKHLEGQYTEKIWFAQNLVHRARRLETVVDDERPSDWRQTFDGQSYPLLQSLAIHQYSMFRSSARLNIDAPDLVSVVLKNTVPIFPSPLRMLRKLVIHLEEGFMLSDDAPILNILRTTPLLSRLELKMQYIAGSPIEERLASKAPIALDHLRSADIQLQGVVDAGLIWPSLRIPQATKIRTALLSDCSKPADLLSGISRQLHCTCCNLVNVYLDRIFAFSTSSSRVAAHAHGHASLVKLTGDINTMLALVPTYTNTTRVESLLMRIQTPYDIISSATVLLPFFRAYSSVTILRLDTDMHTTSELYNLLAENARGSDEPVFPALDILCVMQTSDMYLTYLEPAQDHWNAVLSMLEARAVRRRRVRLLLLWGVWAWKEIADPDGLREIEKRAMNLAAIYVDKVEDERKMVE